MRLCTLQIIVVALSVPVQASAVKRGEGIPYENTNDGLMKTEISSKLYQDLKRRSLLDFKKMIEHIIGRSAFHYNYYGCHCGIGGSGAPVDDIDRCCQSHDRCYSDLVKAPANCSRLYFKDYKWSATSKNKIICGSNQRLCDSKLCDCDRLFVECIEGKQYNDRYHGMVWTFKRLGKCYGYPLYG